MILPGGGESLAKSWKASFEKAMRWGAFLAAHALITIVLIGIIWVIQTLLIAEGDPKLFDWMPIRYIFDLMDLAILATFLVCGTREAIMVFWESDDE